MSSQEKCNLIDRLRGPKIFNMAAFDWICTFIAAIIICYIFCEKLSVSNVLFVFVCLIVLAIIVHKIFGINTMLNAYLGLNSKNSVMERRKNC
jgi:uncharacterized membrane protein YcaP (DUF421 family)